MFKVVASDFFFFSLAEPFIKTEIKKNFAILISFCLWLNQNTLWKNVICKQYQKLDPNFLKL